MCVAGKDSSWRDRKSSLCRSWCFCFSGRSAISGFSISSSSSPGWQEKGAKGQTYTHLMRWNNDVRRENEGGGGMQMYRLRPQTVSGALQADIKHMDAHLMSRNNEVPGEVETPVSILSHFLFLHKILIMSIWDLQYKIQTASGNGSLFQFCISTLSSKAMPLMSLSSFNTCWVQLPKRKDYCFSLSYTMANGESVGFGPLVWRKRQFKETF